MACKLTELTSSLGDYLPAVSTCLLEPDDFGKDTELFEIENTNILPGDVMECDSILEDAACESTVNPASQLLLLSSEHGCMEGTCHDDTSVHYLQEKLSKDT